VARHLDKLGYTYEVDEDGDYRMVFDVEGDRTQMVYVRSAVEDFGSHNIREIWSPAYSAKTKQFRWPWPTACWKIRRTPRWAAG
jgi:hypothetical protein